MDWGVFIITAGLFFFLVLIPIALIQAQILTKQYGPAQPLDSAPTAQGRLTCRSAKAPTLGRKLVFDYELSLTAVGGDLTGEYRYPPESSGKKAIYTGEVLLSYRGGQVRGRLRRKVVEGALSPVGGELMMGFPKESIMGRFSGPFEFAIEGETVRLLNTSNAHGSIAPDSRLSVSENEVIGWLAHPRGSWVVDVDVKHHGAAREAVLLAVLLVSNEILEFHHDR